MNELNLNEIIVQIRKERTSQVDILLAQLFWDLKEVCDDIEAHYLQSYLQNDIYFMTPSFEDVKIPCKEDPYTKRKIVSRILTYKPDFNYIQVD